MPKVIKTFIITRDYDALLDVMALRLSGCTDQHMDTYTVGRDIFTGVRTMVCDDMSTISNHMACTMENAVKCFKPIVPYLTQQGSPNDGLCL